ncbi:MAG: histidine kinase, partial [Bryobacterales bacterium]|nr:histidine kinase [Bryobacterales bacterium]
MTESLPRPLIHQHPMLVGLRITIGAIVVGPWALSLLMVSAMDFQITPEQALKELVISQVHFLFYGALLFGAICYARMRPNTSMVMKAFVFVAIVFVASMTSLLVCEWVGLDTADDLMASMAHSMGIGVTVSAIVLLIERTYHRLVVTRRESERRELERERALRLAAEARWSSLESRMRPHFVFNTLSSIRELMHRDIPQADRMVERFAELIRFSLDAAGRPGAPLEEELRMVANYLAIEEMRFGKRIRWSIEVAACAGSA